MFNNKLVGILMGIAFVLLRGYYISRLISGEECKLTEKELTIDGFGVCKDGVRTYFNVIGIATGRTIECGTTLADSLTQVSCVLSGDGDAKKKTVYQMCLLVVTIFVTALAIPEFLRRIILTALAMVSFGDTIFASATVAFTSVTWAVMGDFVIRGAGEMTVEFASRPTDQPRDASGRFYRTVIDHR